MRAFVVSGPGTGAVEEVAEPVAVPGEVVLDVDVVGLCGTDIELYHGTMPYFTRGLTVFPHRPGHEWTGTIRELGAGVEGFAVGDRVVGDTFVTCDVCEYCRSGQRWLCESREEIGVLGARPGALAERLAVPAKVLFRVPDSLASSAAPFVEPGGCAMRAIRKAQAGPGATILIWGAGTVGLLAALFARARGAEVTIVERSAGQADLARSLGFECVASIDDLGGRGFSGVIEATGSSVVPALALRTVAAGGRLVLVGVPETEITLDLGRVIFADITIVGVLGGSEGIPETIDLLASGVVDVQPLVARQVGLDEVNDLLTAGLRLPGVSQPKFQVVPAGA